MCGNGMHDQDARNALSRYYNVYICSNCGNVEAMRDFHELPPLRPDQWYVNPLMLIAMNDGRLYDDGFDENGYIIPKYDPRYKRR